MVPCLTFSFTRRITSASGPRSRSDSTQHADAPLAPGACEFPTAHDGPRIAVTGGFFGLQAAQARIQRGPWEDAWHLVQDKYVPIHLRDSPTQTLLHWPQHDLSSPAYGLRCVSGRLDHIYYRAVPQEWSTTY